MKKNKFLRISKYKKLRYIANNYKKNLYIVFLPGFASDIDGDKPNKFLNFSIKNKLGFLALEYFGHGRSSGEFTKGNITKWSNDAKTAINKIVKKNDFILIGSSMGGWISMIMTNKVLNKKLNNTIPVTMVHGQKDEVVPVKYSRMVLKTFPKADKKLLIIKNGDHSLSSSKNLSIICKELQKIIKKVN